MITKDNIRKYLKTRKGNKYYFKFPDKGLLIVEGKGIAFYWTGKEAKKEIKQFVLEHAYSAYKKKK